MGIVTAILGFLAALAKAIFAALTWWAQNVPWWLTCILIGGVLLFAWGVKVGGGGLSPGCSCREIACGCRPRPPRPTRWDSYSVVSVTTGVSIEVKAGLAGKRTRTITLASVACPLSPDLAEESRANLEALAGKTIRVEHHGLLRATPNEMQSTPGQDSQRRLDEEQTESVDRDNKEWESWYSEHVKHCPVCRGKPGEGPPPLCQEAFTKLQEILRKGMVQVDCWVCDGTGKLEYPADPVMHLEAREDDCYRCGGKGKWWTSHPREQEAKLAEARGPIVGRVFGESGADLAIVQASAGMVTVNDGASKELKAAEAKARAKKIGLWANNE